jgi:hypothetical protein
MALGVEMFVQDVFLAAERVAVNDSDAPLSAMAWRKWSAS